MELTAALDIGSDKIVMAIGEERQDGTCILKGMKMIASGGVEKGVVTDFGKVHSYVHYLLKELDKERQVVSVNVMLPYSTLQVSEHKITVPVQRKTVKESDIDRAETKCREMIAARSEELIDITPVAFYVDRSKYTLQPLGSPAKDLEVRFRAYKADKGYLNELKSIFSEVGIEDIRFYPPPTAYMQALDVDDDSHFVLVDMGASHTSIIMFHNGLPVREATLPLGTDTVDRDIAAAFQITDFALAKPIKHKYGEAIRSMGSYGKVQIPELKVEINRKDLLQVIQCRLEELLEGVVYQLQQWGFTKEGIIYLTGNGSSLLHTTELLSLISGNKVKYAKALNVQTDNDALLDNRACFGVLGLLTCSDDDTREEQSGGLGGWFSKLF
ncbi:MAG: cell division protein FtsA [Culturomica sp.]|jgi:cell division protein FtsA|nr:cell division protein FtsA [Culturomica sp.]